MAVARASPEDRKELAEKLRLPRKAYQEQSDSVEEDDGDADEIAEEIPFKPSLSSIQEISDRMASDSGQPRAVVDTEFIILELEDALGSMIFRWDTCLSDYKKEASAKDCQKKIRELVQEGIQYLQQYKGRSAK